MIYYVLVFRDSVSHMQLFLYFTMKFYTFVRQLVRGFKTNKRELYPLGYDYSINQNIWDQI